MVCFLIWMVFYSGIFITFYMVRNNEHTFNKMNITPLGLQILTFLGRHPDEQFYIREIAKKMDKSVGGTHKTLKSLKEMNLIIENKSGKNIYYQINQMNSSISHFKIFVTINELTPLVKKLKDISVKIILFGSCARGEDTIESDIDLFVLTNKKENVNKTIFQSTCKRTIQAVVVNTTEFMDLKERDKGFYQEITNGITLYDNHV